MKPTITSNFLRDLINLFASHLIDLIYTKVHQALYIDEPYIGSTLIQDSEFFKKQVKELILDHLAEPAAHTIIYINNRKQKLTFYTQEEWENHALFDCSNISYLNYQCETHLVTLAILF